MTGAQTAREAMSRIVLGELDALTERIETAVQRLDAMEGNASKPTAPADLTQAARDLWTIIGAAASRSAAEASVVALRKVLDERQPPKPSIPAWLIVLLGLNLLVSSSCLLYLLFAR